MKLSLSHGRINPDQDMEDKGFQGAILENVIGLNSIYGNIQVRFSTDEALIQAKLKTGWETLNGSLEMRTFEDMIETIEGYFGDWELIA